MTALGWFFVGMLAAEQGQQPRAAEQERLQLARQRAAMLHALRQVQAVEVRESTGPGRGEGLHAHEILLLVDRGLGVKHSCKAQEALEWLERQR